MMRMNYEQFIEILMDIEPVIAKVQGGHKVFSPAEKLVLTIRLFATGESFTSHLFTFNSVLVNQLFRTLIVKYARQYIKNLKIFPHRETSASRKRLQVSLLKDAWQFPNCIGAINGKHLVMQPPIGSRSHYFNHKHT